MTRHEFLVDLVAHGRSREMKEGAENVPAVKRLVDGGYCTLSPAFCGPLGIRTGAYFLQIIEAGRKAVADNGDKL